MVTKRSPRKEVGGSKHRVLCGTVGHSGWSKGNDGGLTDGERWVKGGLRWGVVGVMVQDFNVIMEGLRWAYGVGGVVVQDFNVMKLTDQVRTMVRTDVMVPLPTLLLLYYSRA